MHQLNADASVEGHTSYAFRRTKMAPDSPRYKHYTSEIANDSVRRQQIALDSKDIASEVWV